MDRHLERQVDDARGVIDSTLDQLVANIQRLEDEKDDLNDEIDLLRKQISDLESEIKELKANNDN